MLVTNACTWLYRWNGALEVSKTYNQHPFHIWQVQDSQLFLGIFFPESKLQILKAIEERKVKAKLSRLLLQTWQTKAIISGSNECRPSNTSSSRHIHSWKQRVARSTPWTWRHKESPHVNRLFKRKIICQKTLLRHPMSINHYTDRAQHLIIWLYFSKYFYILHWLQSPMKWCKILKCKV